MNEEQEARERRSIILRLIAGAYLLYLTYGLMKDVWAGQVTNLLLILAAGAVFGIIGAILVVTSCRYLYQHRNK